MHRSAGFTLLELLVVIGVLSVLTGLSVGYLGRTDPKMVADTILGGELRQAQLTARSEGVPTDVTIRPAGEGEPWVVQARLLQPVATFHFEPREPVLDESLRGVVGGEEVREGRFGQARRHKAGEHNPVLLWNVTPSVLDLRDGFVVRLDLWLDRRDACTVLRLPPSVELMLDVDGRARARFRVRAAGADGTTLAGISSQLALPLRRWCTLDVGCDGRAAWLTLDGREIARGAADGMPQQEPESVFQVSPHEAPVPGAVDEVRWFVYALAPPQYLPAELQPAQQYRFTFDARGEPIEQPTVRFLAGEERQ